jgi:hypothetical protein
LGNKAEQGHRARPQRWWHSVLARIIVLAVILVVGFVANGVSFNLNEAQVDRSFDHSTKASRSVESGLELKGALGALQGVAREFAAQPSETLIAAFDGAYDAATRGVTDMAAYAGPDDSGRIGGLRDQLVGVRNRFVALVEQQRAFGLTEASGIHASLQAAGAAIDRMASSDLAQAIDEKRFILSLTTSRRLDFEYRLTRTGFLRQLFETEIDNAKSLLRGGGLDAWVAEQHERYIATYAEAFAA